MSGFLAERSPEPERMDDFTTGGAELTEALVHLRRLNRIFGASGPALYGVRTLWEHLGRPRQLTLLDVGAGSGDINVRLLRWARKQGVELNVILVDVTEEAIAEAGRLFRDEPRVTFFRSDLFELPSRCADIVTASQFAHHFDSGLLPNVIDRMLDVSRAGIVINDIHRHWIAWSAVWLATRLLSANRYIRHDGPLSVAKGFRRSDFRDAARKLDIPKMTVSWRPLFRYSAIVPKPWE
ncbi:methyltransferase domain-containing protein [Cohnella panacarvi]|uniref:methyltransferase domain-containing protein n=1 Tax=Cohnella panacarvi TaxID=400776 RepID=UPI00047DC4AA|nr:methyltransferase domain-containing protein [Cohnella panacarvi]